MLALSLAIYSRPQKPPRPPSYAPGGSSWSGNATPSHTQSLETRAVRRGKAPTGAGHAHSCGQAAASDPYRPARWEDCMATTHAPHTPGVITDDQASRIQDGVE